MTETRTSTSRSAILQLDAPVLRQALLGDVQLAEDLQARDDLRLEVPDLRRDDGFQQHAVNAVADAQLVLERLEVHVGRAPVNRLGQHLVDELDDRGVLGAAGEVEALLVLVLDDLDAGVGGVGDEGLQRVRADAEAVLDAPVNLGGRRQRQAELLPGEQAQFVHAGGAEQPAGHRPDLAAGRFHRQQAVLEQDPGREPREEFLGRRRLLQVHVRHLELGRQVAQHLVLRQPARFEQRLVERLALGRERPHAVARRPRRTAGHPAFWRRCPS